MFSKRPINTFRTWLAIAAAGVALATTAGPATAAGGLALEGVTPLVCAASMTPPTGDPSAPLQVREFCNDPNGFEVWIDYPPSLANASIMIDGRTVQLGGTGSTLVDSSAVAASATKSLTLDQALAPSQSSLSLRVVAL